MPAAMPAAVLLLLLLLASLHVSAAAAATASLVGHGVDERANGTATFSLSEREREGIGRLFAAVDGDDLAPALCDAAERLWRRQPDEPAATARLGLALRRSLARIVLRSSAVQSLKGLLTAGGMRSVQYLGAKLAKRLR